MDDPGEEWEIEQYSTSGEEVSESKISRILSGGLWLGKKFVITGFLMSSAPVVLPPLVVVSALGFAVSIPFGVVFAGYTCTEKLMSKLLPIPESSGILDYGMMDKAEDDRGDEGEFAMDAEEKTQIQDTNESVEMRIELVEDGNEEQQKENMMPVMDQSEDFVEGSLIKDSGDEKPPPAVKEVVVVVGEESKNANDVKKTRDVVVVARPTEGETESAPSKREEEMEVLKAESTGLLEKIRDEGKSEESAKKNKKKNKDRLKKSLGFGLGGKKGDESAKNTKEMEKTSEIRHENQNKFAAGTGRADARQANEISTEQENIDIEISGELRGETMKDAVLDDRENAPVAEKPVGSQRILINGNRLEGKPNLVSEEVNPAVGKKQASQGPEMQEATLSNRHEDMPVESNTIHRESTEGNGVPSKAEAAKATTEISPSEKNLWEQINAMRLIVGHKGVRQPSFTEELKALYVFTGVEPPSSFEDSSNIRDAEDKLRFLMSIVGVK